MRTPEQDTNYWPGYVDALVNVVINLLFLVAILVVGLISINAEAMLLEKNRIQQLLQQLTSPTASLASKQASLSQLFKPAPPRRPRPPQEQSEPEVQVELLDLKEFHIKNLNPGSSLNAAVTIKPGATASGRPAGSTIAPERLAEQVGGGRYVGKFNFDKTQFDLPANAAVPASVNADSDGHWLLLVVTETDNPRLAREAFVRLTAARKRLLQAGVPAEQIRVRSANPPAGTTVPETMEQQVFILSTP